MKRLFFALLLALPLVTSCFKDDIEEYNLFDFCNVKNGQLVSDNNLTYNVVKKECQGNWQDYSRVFINFDLIEELEDNNYNINLRYFSEVPIKSPVELTGSVESDPVDILNIWTGGTYLNIGYEFICKNGNPEGHEFTLAYDKEKSSKDVMFFELIHDAGGDVFQPEAEGFELYDNFCSFDIIPLLPEGKGSVTITVKYLWFNEFTQAFDTEEKEVSINVNY